MIGRSFGWLGVRLRRIAAPVAGLMLAAAAAQADGLTLNITDTGFDPIPAGGTIEYQVRVENGGNTRSVADTLEFTIPAGTIYTGTSGDLAGCTPAPEVQGEDVVSCPIPDLAPRGKLEGTVNLVPAGAGTVTLEGNLIAAEVTESETTTVNEGADLELAFSGPTDIRSGEILTFFAEITNNGPYAAKGTELSLTLPSALSNDVNLPGGCEIVGNQVTCKVTEEIAVGATKVLEFSSQVLTDNESTVGIPGSIDKTSPSDPDGSNDSSSFSIQINPGTDLTLSKSRSPSGLLYLGQDITFTLTPGFVGITPLAAVITDNLPANYKLDSVAATGAGWSCNAVDQLVECTYSSATEDEAGYRAPIEIVATPITETSGTPVTNTAHIAAPDDAGDSADVRLDNNSASDGGADIVKPATDLVAEKSGPAHGLVTVGNRYDWQIWTRNDGNIGFEGTLILTDHLPAGLELTAINAPADWTCTSESATGPADIICTSPTGYTLAVGARTPPITLTTEVLAEGSISNSMTVSYEDENYADRDLTNNTTTSGVNSGDGTTVQIADLRLEKTVTDPEPHLYQSGDPVSIKIEVFNDGSGDATEIRILDRLEDLYFADNTTTAVTLDSVPADMSCNVVRGAGFYSDLTCTIPLLEAEDSRVITLTALAGGNAGTKTNRAETYSTETPDPNYDNNAGSATYGVTARTDVTVEKTASHANGAEVKAGEQLIYTISAIVPANGLSAADGVTITDTLPAGLRIVSAIPSQGSCAAVTGLVNGITTTGSQLVCNLGAISNGNQQTVTVTTVPSTELVGTTIENKVAVSTTTPEVDPDNNEAEIAHQITRPSLDLITNKTDDPDPVEVGQTTTYTITVHNAGPSEAFNLLITDRMPDLGMSFQSVTPGYDGLSCTSPAVDTLGGQVECKLAYLPVGSTASFTVEMKAEARGRSENTVTARSDEYDYETNKTNNDVIERTSVFERSNLRVTKDASSSEVDLGEVFNWQITVENVVADGIGLAENVVLTDTLPANMEVVGALTTSSTPGTLIVNCDAPTGGRNLICIADEMKAGEAFTVTLPVRVTSVTQNPETVSNSATVTTDSFDVNPEDNTGTGTVEVLSTSVSGSIWRDFNEDNARADHDSGISGLTVTLTGTGGLANGVSATTTTGADGSYSFTLLPPGTYSVSYTPPTGDTYQVGSALPGGTGGGAADGNTSITGTTATTAAFATQKDFTLIPQAMLALAKQVSEPTFQNDGSYQLTYTFRIRNMSQEPVSQFTLTDNLVTAFGSLVTGTPGHGEFSVGDITGATLTSGTVTQLVLDSSSALDADATRTITMVLHINPELPRTAPEITYTNNAMVSGTGDWSGQPPKDASNNGSTPQRGVESNTSRTIEFAPAIEVVKTAELEQAGASPAPDDIIRYSFTITNTGNTPLQDVALEDLLPDLLWDRSTTIPYLDLQQADSTSYQAHYVLTQGDIEAGSVTNTATVTGIWAEDGVEGGPTVSDEDTAIVEALAEPSLAVEKSEVENSIQNPTQPGDTITYEFTVTNTGNVTIRDLVLTDAMLGLVGSDAIDVGTLVPENETGASSFTVSRTYAVTQGDIDAGEVVNTAFANGTHGPGDTPIEEPSNPVTTELFPDPEMQVTKLPDAAVTEPRAGDEITWTVTIKNTGNTRLEITDIVEPLTGASVSGPAQPVLEPGDSATATVTYTLTQADIDAGEVVNQVTVSGRVPGSELPFDPTHSGNDPDDPNEDETVTPLPAVPSIALLKALTSDVSEPLMPGDEIAFDFTIRNTGNVTLSNIALTDDLPGVMLDLTPLAGLTLAPGDDIVVTGTYELTVADIEAGGLENTATVTGADPHDTPVSDDSGTGFNNDDPTVVPLIRQALISLVKTADEDPGLSTPPQVGDEIHYSFVVTNEGNVPLTLTLDDILDGVHIESVRTDPLPPGATDSVSFTAVYVLTQADIDAGQVHNEATVTGDWSNPDDPDDTLSAEHSDTEDVDVPQTPGVSLIKTVADELPDVPQAGEEIVYTFVITNTGNTTLHDLELEDDMLHGTAVADDDGSAIGDWPDGPFPVGSLAPGEARTLHATYILTQDDIEEGEIRNQAQLTGTHGGSPGDPDDPSAPIEPVYSSPEPGDPDETVLDIPQVPGIELIKTVDDGEPFEEGDEITYRFEIRNTGNLILTDVTVADELDGVDLDGGPITQLLPGEEDTDTFTATYVVTAADVDHESIENHATASGQHVPVDGEDEVTADSSVEVEVGTPELTLTIEVVEVIDHDGNGMAGPGDEIVYSFTVENAGTIPLLGVNIIPESVRLLLPDLVCAPVDLAVDPAEPPEVSRITLECSGTSYFITQSDLDQDKVTLSGTARGETRSGTEVTDDDSVTTPLGTDGVDLVKLADVSLVQVGDVVPWTLTASNVDAPDGALPVVTRLVDTLPRGFTYLAGTARIDGIAVEPEVDARSIIFDSVEIEPKGTTIITFDTLVSSSVQPGTHTNHARLYSLETGLPISPEATATVRVEVDGVFQCSTVLGRVFDDRNQDGHMTESGAETGLPNVRLVTPNGIAILTDEHGRYNVPCAALPDNIGSNFMLRLDERTLPTGYRLTTENPRVVRLTPGMITRLDFGATLSQLVRVDLAAGAFVDGEMRPELVDGLARMVAELHDMPVMLRITWLLGAESEADARRAMREVERELRRLWPGNGRYQLNVETVIERGTR